ncbi:PREDICTED: uncharacterized protein LOC102013854 [Chinchilla lanigera]|uniref:uncharacterized protein LOC102013854 n=1 Tax=Chinchilla lanigera TaxID=34839 RepID=UPI0006967F66|nr:PREDICTED: uncharacterized protein LOC102013854 [Chinchilla lanigera]
MKAPGQGSSQIGWLPASPLSRGPCHLAGVWGAHACDCGGGAQPSLFPQPGSRPRDLTQAAAKGQWASCFVQLTAGRKPPAQASLSLASAPAVSKGLLVTPNHQEPGSLCGKDCLFHLLPATFCFALDLQKFPQLLVPTGMIPAGGCLAELTESEVTAQRWLQERHPGLKALAPHDLFTEGGDGCLAPRPPQLPVSPAQFHVFSGSYWSLLL